jgi:23S rRNA pseudouridine1911/1915/1917 synthase
MPLTTLSATIVPDVVGRVDSVVRSLTGASHSQVRGMFDHGCVSINGAACHEGGTVVVDQDVVTLRYDSTQRYREKKRKAWDDRTFTIVFEDEHLIVVDKAAGTLTVPTDNDERNTLVERVSVYLSHSRSEREAFVVHRLDRAVSGLLVFGKHLDVAERLIQQFRDQKPQRVYAAIVAGVMTQDEGTFRSNLATGQNLDRFVSHGGNETETAVTHYRVIKRMADTTLVEAVLETGKRNQVRVHFTHAGFPVLGDPRYDSHKAKHPRWIRSRIALHAKTLGFTHPVTAEKLLFESPLPVAMEKFLKGSR